MESKNKKIWFPAKRYGWGWGPPNCWQGWFVTIGWFALVYGGAYVFRPDHHLALFLAFIFAMCAILITICLLKGEKPKWRWGGK